MTPMTGLPVTGHDEPVTIDPESSDLYYEQLARILRVRIASGKLTTWMPPKRELSEHYGVAPGTAEKALAILVTEGLIRLVKGRGYYVNPPEDRP